MPRPYDSGIPGGLAVGWIDPERHHRRSIRLKGWDYRWPGAYFVTIVTHGRQLLFGEVEGGEVVLSLCGRVVKTTWQRLPRHFTNVELDLFVVMPNHLHGIVWILDRGDGLVEVSPKSAEAEKADTADELRTAGKASGERPRPDGERGSDVADGARHSQRGQQAREGRADKDGMLQRSVSRGMPRPYDPEGVKSGSLGAVLGNLKSVAARRINRMRPTPAVPVWQRGYYERIIRNERELEAIRQYILDNPTRWDEDAENPACCASGSAGGD